MTLAIAHRGDPIGHLENTLPAFIAAAEQGADMIELDCQLSGDGHVVVVHDPTLSRLWGLERAVSDTSWEAIAALRQDEYRLPLLGEVLEACRLPVMVDVTSPAIVAGAHREVLAAMALERCVFVGDTAALCWLRAAEPEARIGLTWNRPELPSDELLAEVHPEWFNPRYDLARSEVIDAMRDRGLATSCWTVDDEQAMSDLLDAGVEAIVTNRVATLVRLISTRAREGHGSSAATG